jgi:two-component system alkaline phosphatase synthesis response regulator PhoP
MTQRILIVDDEPSIVVPLEFLMKREGYEVSVAEDGRAALEALDRSAPDLVILDVMLPKMSGFDVCRHIRADPRWRGLKILMLTAKGRDSEMQRGLELGADAYVTKPFSTRELVERIRALLARAP